MQRCEKCGQVNYNYEDQCAYCGADLYISVDENDDYSSSDNDLTNDIINELSQSESEPIDINDNPFNRVIEENQFIEKEDIFGLEEEINIDEISDVPLKANIEDEQTNKKPHILELQDDLKKKIKRNKKLEKSLGLFFKEISVDMENLTSPINIRGYYFLNPNKHIDEIKLSAICYDVLKNKIERNHIILKKSISKEFQEFTISINPNIHKTAMIILLPEEIEEVVLDDFNTSITENEEVHHQESNNIFIEQIKEIERKIGMTISNTSIIIKSNSRLEIVGEIYIKNPDKYKTIKIVATCYDSNNHILASQSTNLNPQLYLGFDTLKLVVDDVNVKHIERIKLYPTLQDIY